MVLRARSQDNLKGEDVPNGKPLPFNEIAQHLDPLMPLRDYNQVRAKYFDDVIVPKIPRAMSTQRAAIWESFLKQTERPALLKPSERAMASAGLIGLAGTKEMLAPLAGFIPQAKQAYEKLEIEELALRKLAEREGMSTSGPEMIGQIAGSTPLLLSLFAGAGAAVPGLIARAGMTGRIAQLTGRALRGGLAFGSYEAATELHGDRLTAGLKGFGIGASFELVLGLPAFLRGKGVQNAEAMAAKVARGEPVPPEVDKLISEKILSEANTAAAQGRPGFIIHTPGAPGVRAKVIDSSGQVQTIAITPGKESIAIEEVTALLKNRGTLEGIEVHPDFTPSANNFLRQLENQYEKLYENTLTIKTAPGRAEAVAKQSVSEGIPAEAIAADEVELHVIQTPGNLAPKPSQVAKAAELQSVTAPSSSSIELAVDAARTPDGVALDSSTKNFFKRQIEIVWDDSIPKPAKEASLKIVQGKFPQFVPEQHILDKAGSFPSSPKASETLERTSEAMSRERAIEVLESFGVKNPTDEAIEKAIETGEAELVRVLDITDRTKQLGVDVQRSSIFEEVKDRFEPPGGLGMMFDVSGEGVVMNGKKYPTIQRALNESGKYRFLMEPTGMTTPERQVAEATLEGRILGSVEDVPTGLPAAKVRGALENKGFATMPLRGWQWPSPRRPSDPAMEEIIYFDPKSRTQIRELFPVIRDYDNFITAQRGDFVNSFSGKVQPVGEEAHRRMGKAFGIPGEEVERFVTKLKRSSSSEGMIMAPESTFRRHPTGYRLSVTEEELHQIVPGARGVSMRDWRQFYERMGITIPPGADNSLPLMLLTPNRTKGIIYHEALHSALFRAGIEMKSLVEKHVSAVGIKKGLAGLTKAYKAANDEMLNNEAFTWAAHAIRTGDVLTLDTLARWDKDIPSITKMVNEVSGDIIDALASAKDTVANRYLQRKVVDLLNRTSPHRTDALVKSVEEAFDSSFRDMTSKTYRATDKQGVEHVFDSAAELHNVAEAMDISVHAPNWSYMAEIKGVRGPLTAGRPPRSTDLPLPEASPSPDLIFPGLRAARGLFQPMGPWVAKTHKLINDKLAGQKRYFPILERWKAVDDAVLDNDKWFTGSLEGLRKELSGVAGERQKDFHEYLAHTASERAGLVGELKFTTEELQKLESLERWLGDFKAETKIDALDFMQNKWRQLRSFGFNTETVFGTNINPKRAGFWEKAVKFDVDLEAKDQHLGRFLTWLTRKGLEKKLGPVMEDLEKLVNLKTKQGGYFLGPMQWPLKNYVSYIKGQPDYSQRLMRRSMADLQAKIGKNFAKLNKFLPEGSKLPESFKYPDAVINRLLIFSYAAGLGARPALIIRDTMQALLNVAVMGPGRFTRGMTSGLTSAGWDRAEKAGALLGKSNVGELYGDIVSELPIGGKGALEKMTRWSNTLLSPARWGNNLGRAISYNGEFDDALRAIKAYRAGKISVDQLINDKTTLWFTDEAAATRLVTMAGDVAVPEADVARRMALELIDITQWPYRRGTQPALLRTGAGRVLGQYGVWPLNYADFLRRLASKSASGPSRRNALMATAWWAGTHLTMTEVMEDMGVDAARWFLFSPAGYAGGPHFEFILNAMKAADESEEGRRARRDILEYPLNFIPGSVEGRAILRAIERGEIKDFDDLFKPGPGLVRILGLRPFEEQMGDKDFQEWIAYELGYQGTGRLP